MALSRTVPPRGTRCWWCGTDPVYVRYHDTEWGVPETGDRALYEKLVLDGFQAGLSWITILRKRPAFRRAFDGFDPAKVARYGSRDVARLLRDDGIVRSRAKIEGAIANARAWERVMDAGGRGAFRDLLWQHVDHGTKVNRLRTPADIRPSSTESERMAKTLRKAGFKFCGPVICHAFMQAVGMVNDHLVSCPRHAACATIARRAA
jgi:DNA-3-methyladenine glycosylase I